MHWLLSALLNPWLHTISALLAPFALRLLPMFRNNSSSSSQRQHRRRQQQQQQQHSLASIAPLRAPVSVFLALYALYTLYILTFARPPNLFTTLRLPLNAPQSTIRAAILRQDDYYSPSSLPLLTTTTTEANGSTAIPELPPALEKLLARLASSDTRTILVRFGQRVVQTCSHCTSEVDYALHALPPALLSYTLATAVLGLVTVRGTARESRRSIGLMLLVVAALVEAYLAYMAHIRIPPRPKHKNDSLDNVIMWHDTLWSLRHALFLALPLSIHLLPAPSTTTTNPAIPPLSTTLPNLAQTADTQLARAHLLRLSTAATHRIPELRAHAAAFWARERALGTALRRDSDVRVAAEKIGLGIAPPPPPPPPPTSSEDGSASMQKRAATVTGESGHEDSGGNGGGGEEGEGALHKAARAAVATLKEAVLRSSPPSDGGAQQ